MANVLEPYERICPECQGKGVIGNDGKPWEGKDPSFDPGYMEDYSKCWGLGCHQGVIPTEEGEALLRFLKRHLRIDVSGQWK